MANFTSFRITEGDDEKTRFLILKRPGKLGLEGLIWPKEEGEGVEVCRPFAQIRAPKFDIRRIYGPIEKRYTTPLAYLLGALTQSHRRSYYLERFKIDRFRRNFRFSAERMDILTKIVDWERRQLSDKAVRLIGVEPFSHIDLYGEIYSMNAWFLDDHERLLAELKFVTDSLVSTGELLEDRMGYRLSAKALATLSNYERENRVHLDSRRQANRIVWLTVVLALTGIVSASIAVMGYFFPGAI